MRAWVVILAVLAGACVDVKPQADNKPEGETKSGYTLEVRAGEAEQVFIVTAPDGEIAAARAAGGASALMDAAALRTFLAAAPAAEGEGEEGQEVVSLRLPGVELTVSGDGGAADGGRVSINAGGHRVEVDANEGGPGESDDRAHVRITGVPAGEAREFIAKADQLSPEVKAQMLAALGLE